MDAKIRSYFYLGKFDSLIKLQDKKTEENSLLLDRALILTDKSPSLPHPNIGALKTYTSTGEVPAIASGPLDETLALILSFNTNRESNILDSVTPKTLESKLLIILSLLKLRRLDIAEVNLKEALKNEEEEGALNYLYACYMNLKGDLEESESLVNELKSMYGESVLLLNLEGLNLLQESKYAEAHAKFVEALQCSQQMGEKIFEQMSLRNIIASNRLQGEQIDLLEQ